MVIAAYLQIRSYFSNQTPASESEMFPSREGNAPLPS